MNCKDLSILACAGMLLFSCCLALYILYKDNWGN